MRWSSAQQSTWSRTAKGSKRPQDNWRLPRSKRASCGAYYTMRGGNIIAIEGTAMTRVAHTSEQLNFTRIVINAKSVKSKRNTMAELHGKMKEYIENSSQMG